MISRAEIAADAACHAEVDASFAAEVIPLVVVHQDVHDDERFYLRLGG